GPAAQHLMVGFQPLLQGLHDPEGLEFEAPFGNLAGIFASVLPQPASQRQAQQEARQYGVNRLALDEFLLDSGFAGQFAEAIQRCNARLPAVPARRFFSLCVVPDPMRLRECRTPGRLPEPFPTPRSPCETRPATRRGKSAAPGPPATATPSQWSPP